MTTLSFNSVPSDPFGGSGVVTRIKTLIETIENYGVDKKFLFTVEDLYEAKHIPKVVRCLEEIEKLVSLAKPKPVAKRLPNGSQKAKKIPKSQNMPKEPKFSKKSQKKGCMTLGLNN
jgi:hypothetical protein